MLRLTTLGVVGLTDAAHPSTPHPVLGQPKRLALLAHLTVAYPGALARRDTLVGLLWPEYDASRARRALRQTLYHLRRQLGEEVLVGGGRSGVGVDADRVWCDAVAFEQAVAADRLEDALDLYGGELLPGLHAGSREYDHWLDTARERLRRKAVAAAMALVDRAEAEGDLDAATRHARWLLGVAPYDERAARTLIRLLAAGGDRAGAVAEFDALADRLERHLELEPDPDTRTLLEAVRAGDVGRAEKDDSPAPVPAARPEAPPAEHALAVLPFSSLPGTAAERRFADGLTEMLITALARETSLAVISRTSVLRHRPGTLTLSDMAAELGVDRVVEGTVQHMGDRLRVTAQLLTTPPERHIWADSFEREMDDPLAGQAELAAAMARSIERALDTGPRGLSTSASVAARDAYFRGRCQFVRMTPAGFVEAVRQFQEAIRLDPGFARASPPSRTRRPCWPARADSRRPRPTPRPDAGPSRPWRWIPTWPRRISCSGPAPRSWTGTGHWPPATWSGVSPTAPTSRRRTGRTAICSVSQVVTRKPAGRRGAAGSWTRWPRRSG